MKNVDKSLAAVLREGCSGPELLVFQHPTAGVQLPKGTVDAGEGFEAAARRELFEESGLSIETPAVFLETWDRVVGGGPNEDGPLETNRWWVYVFWTSRDLPDMWDHRAEGSPEEDGLLFSFFWEPVGDDLISRLMPVFVPVGRMITAHVERHSP